MKLCLLLFVCGIFTLSGRRPVQPSPTLLGRWEVVKYSEQGIPVDKMGDALAQATRVYEHVREERARQFYGYDARWDELSRRENRAFARWAELDSLTETRRIAEAIRTPYFAVFFPDSTLAAYNKTSEGLILFPEKRHYEYFPATMSLDIWQPNALAPYGKWDAQIIRLDAGRLTLFLPEDAEIVELIRTEGELP
ncbi:MAG: hypothetical protein IT259_13955 [Saprospiraceae bacterium]|nr:hypothetical protein [Saprospiraceae bacterium]